MNGACSPVPMMTSSQTAHDIPPDIAARFESLGSAQDYVEEIHEVFIQAPLLDALDIEETALLCAFMKCYAAPRGSELIREGEHDDHMIILLTGHADVFVADAAGQPQKVATIGPGVTIGEMSMIDQKPRAATCIATEPVDFVLLERQALRDILITLPRLGNKLLLLLLHVMAERVRQSNQDLLLATTTVNR